MSTMTSEREAFEKWVQDTSGWKACKQRGKPMHLRQNHDGSYNDFRVNDRWFAWQARARLAQPAQAVDVVGYCTHDEFAKLLKRKGEPGHNFAAIEVWNKPFLSSIPLTRALSGEKAGPVDETLVAVYDAVSRSNLTRDVKTPETKARVVRNALLPASPTPDKEQA